MLKCSGTPNPVYNDHIYNEIYYLWFIQQCVLMKTEGTSGHLDEPQNAENYPIRWSL